MKAILPYAAWVWETFSPMIILTAAVSVLLFIFRIFQKMIMYTEAKNWHHAVEENDWDDPETMAYIQRTQPRSKKARAITRIKHNRRKPV